MSMHHIPVVSGGAHPSTESPLTSPFENHTDGIRPADIDPSGVVRDRSVTAGWLRRLIVGVAMMAATGLLAACGSPAASPQPTTTTTTIASPATTTTTTTTTRRPTTTTQRRPRRPTTTTTTLVRRTAGEHPCANGNWLPDSETCP